MATIYTEITEHNWFYNGVQNSGLHKVGYYGGPHVIRYKFKAPAEGATKITIEKKSFLEDGIGSNEKIMFFISTSETSHIDACYVEGASVNPQFDGIFTISDQPDDTTIGYEMATGSVEKFLLPNTDYYLFMFPAFNTTGYYSVYGSNNITITLEGAAGVVRIKDGDNELITVPMVKENGVLINLSATVKIDNSLIYCV